MNIEAIQKLIEFDTPTVANGLELLGVRDPSAGYTGPDVRAVVFGVAALAVNYLGDGLNDALNPRSQVSHQK